MTLDEILVSPSILPYFLQFLQVWGAEKYARLWLDIRSFQASAETYLEHVQQSFSYRLKTSKADVCPESPIDKSINIQSHCSLQNTQKQSPNFSLPDLVSNIKFAEEVTPINSLHFLCFSCL